MTASNLEKKIFKPRPSTGWVWVTILGLILVGTGVNLIMSFGISGPLLPSILLTTPFGILFLIIAAFFPTMRYEMDGSSLTMIYGPLLRYTIDIKQIQSIRRRDLGFSIVSSFRFPGLALFSVPYPGIGQVKMCATAASNGILLLDTGKTKYGITPADEETFVAELRKRMEP